MSNIYVAILTSGRQHLLRLTTQWLLSSLRGRSDEGLLVFPRIFSDPLPLLTGASNFITYPVSVTHCTFDEPPDPQTQEGRAKRCALVRHAAIEWALDDSNFDDEAFLLMVDDDILVDPKSLLEAIADWNWMEQTDYLRPGALTLHGIASHQGYIDAGGKIFSPLKLSGEANVLWKAKALRAVGNHFAPAKGGFGDVQWLATAAAGYQYLDRVWPTYGVQHLGFGLNGSVIHQGPSVPPWCRGPYTCTYKRRDMGKPLTVEGFDLQWFIERAMVSGPEVAAEEYLLKKGVGL